MTVDRKMVATLGAGVILALSGVLTVAGQEPSPCERGGDVLMRDWRVEGVPGTKGRLARSSMECLSDGRIRQVVEVSKDDGRTWKTLFESVYEPDRPGGEAMAAVAPEAEPLAAAPPPSETASGHPTAAEEPARPAGQQSARQEAQHQAARQKSEEGSEVRAVTRELEREEIPEEEAPELIMASPMVLEIDTGEVDDYPEGTAWSTDETAGFVCEQIIIKKVTAARKAKGDNVHLIVGAQLFTPKRQRSADLLVEAVLDGEVIASELLKKVRVGLNIPGHGKEGMMVTALLELPKEQFDRLFSDEADRKLRVTLTVPSA